MEGTLGPWGGQAECRRVVWGEFLIPNGQSHAPKPSWGGFIAVCVSDHRTTRAGVDNDIDGRRRSAPTAVVRTSVGPFRGAKGGPLSIV